MKMNTEHIVPLSRQALILLKDLRMLNGESRYVFTGRNPHRYMSNNTMLYALYRMGYKSRMTGHGFRSMASTILNEQSRFRPDAIERQLAHCERNTVRGAYNRAEYLEERRELMQWWADYLDHLRGEKVVTPQFGKYV
ncbi:prophage integrase IntA [bacterium MnTg02]|nr:prophage integrase IntA [bacterium MnTg02]